jgi:hypothetical protein
MSTAQATGNCWRSNKRNPSCPELNAAARLDLTQQSDSGAVLDRMIIVILTLVSCIFSLRLASPSTSLPYLAPVRICSQLLQRLLSRDVIE